MSDLMTIPMGLIRSVGVLGSDWFYRLREKGHKGLIGSHSRHLLSRGVVPTDGVEYYPVLVRKNGSPKALTIGEIEEVMKRDGYVAPPTELAPLIIENFETEYFTSRGLKKVVVMHPPVPDQFKKHKARLGLRMTWEAEADERGLTYGWSLNPFWLKLGETLSEDLGLVYLQPMDG